MGNLQYKLRQRAGDVSRERSQKILEQEIPGAREGIPRYGADARKVVIKALEDHGTFTRVAQSDKAMYLAISVQATGSFIP